MNGGALPLVAGYVPFLDPTYTDDFWTKPGYMGTDPASSALKARNAATTHDEAALGNVGWRVIASTTYAVSATGQPNRFHYR